MTANALQGNILKCILSALTVRRFFPKMVYVAPKVNVFTSVEYSVHKIMLKFKHNLGVKTVTWEWEEGNNPENVMTASDVGENA